MAGEPRIIREKMTAEEITQIAADTFGDMIKIVVDVDRGILAAGGMLHADAEALLLEDGSNQFDIWGANYFLQRIPNAKLEYTALINIRPSDKNTAQHIQSKDIRRKVKAIVEQWMGPS